MPWGDAVDAFTLPVVQGLASGSQMLWNWQHREGYVPWDRLVPLLLARTTPLDTQTPALSLTSLRNEARGLLVSLASQLREVSPAMASDLTEYVRALFKVVRDLPKDDHDRISALHTLKRAAEQADANRARRTATRQSTSEGVPAAG